MPTHKVSIGEIMEFLQEHMVTKEDLQRELKGFLTKDDARNFLTKDDARNFLTKDDALKFFLTKEDTERFATQKELHDFRMEMTTSFDRFLTLHMNLDTERFAMVSRQDRLEGRVNNIERNLGIATT